MRAPKLQDAIDKATMASANMGFRTHLGGSLIGHECARSVYYDFRWSTLPKAEPRMVRVWSRGDREEFVFEDLLKSAGLEVYTSDAETGEQFRISDFGGHFGGSLDGVACNLPDLPNVWILLEFKTHNNNSFRKLLKEGVRVSKPQHYAQMQVYMGYKKLTHALYCAVNKDNDELYFEIVAFDSLSFDRYKMRADLIVNGESAPDKISSSPAYFGCKFCSHSDVCHSGALPFRTCRSCEFAKVDSQSGVWRCGNKDDVILNKENQLKACQQYKLDKNFKSE